MGENDFALLADWRDRIAVQKLVAQAEDPLPYTCVTHLSTVLVERESVRALG